MNTFLNAMQKQPDSFTENGAVAYSDTGSDLVNYFSNANNLHRSYDEVELDLNKCWSEDKELTVRMIMYVRSITRKSKGTDLKVKGLGMKNEGRLGLKWLYLNHKDLFYHNLIYIIEFGNWQDLWHKDLVDWIEQEDEAVADFIAASLFSNDLCRKYLPRYKSKSNILRGTKSEETIRFKQLRNKGLELVVKAINDRSETTRLFTMRDLMKVKSRGEAHQWQQQISNQNFKAINFDTLPGKVISWMIKEDDTGKSFLGRHGLEDSYIEWLEKQGSVKTTSYIYELIKPAVESYANSYYYRNGNRKLSKVSKYTIEKQIQTILNQAEVSNLNVMPVIDTSGSMTTAVSGNVTALDVCISLGIYFSMLQKGTFKDHIIAFDSQSKFKRLSGSYLDRLKDVLSDQDYMGGTNFQSVVDLIVKTRASNPNVPVEDYPDVYLVISDMQFNMYGRQTNHQASVDKLTQAGLPQPIFIWYNVSPYGNNNFQNHKDDEGVMHISGFDPAAVDRLMSADFQLQFEEEKGKSISEITPYEAMVATLNQDYLKLLNV